MAPVLQAPSTEEMEAEHKLVMDKLSGTCFHARHSHRL